MDKDAARTAARELGRRYADVENGADYYDLLTSFTAGYTEAAKLSAASPDPNIDALAGLGVLSEVRSVASNLIEEHVRELRGKYASWSQIGDALDISKQAAQQRFGS